MGRREEGRDMEKNYGSKVQVGRKDSSKGEEFDNNAYI